MSRRMPSTPTIGDVLASTITCGLLDSEGNTCGKPGMAGLPAGCCETHAIAICRSVLRLGGITVEERKR